MSCKLHWKPVSTDSERAGDIQLREILNKKYGGYPIYLDHSDLTYLGGLIDAGVEGSQDLVDAINKHDQIECFLEC